MMFPLRVDRGGGFQEVVVLSWFSVEGFVEFFALLFFVFEPRLFYKWVGCVEFVEIFAGIFGFFYEG